VTIDLVACGNKKPFGNTEGLFISTGTVRNECHRIFVFLMTMTGQCLFYRKLNPKQALKESA